MKLKNFQKFDSATTALEEVASVIDGKVTPRLANLLETIKDEKKVSLAVADTKLGMFPFIFSLYKLFRLRTPPGARKSVIVASFADC